jgi:3-hydroxyacyl-CoA dehydrogenase
MFFGAMVFAKNLNRTGATDAGKTLRHVENEVLGFVAYRQRHALWREAISLIERGICDADMIDRVIKASFGHRLSPCSARSRTPI